MDNGEKILRILSKITFFIYISLLIWVIIFKCNLINSIYQSYVFMNEYTLYERLTRFVIPFYDYTEDFFSNQIYILLKDDILNVLIFIPFGLYLSYFLKKNKVVKVLLIAFFVCLFFELFQLFSLIGSFAVKDFITNMFGAFIGYLIYKLMYKENNNKIKIAVYNVISILIILLLFPILIYGIVNTIKYFNVYIDVICKRIV